ncbi:MAG: hypothetical protein J5649_09825 [Lachnospiraceae bacterium]|nr:hypothetical protein [Lachnospiraceae bacterium]
MKNKKKLSGTTKALIAIGAVALVAAIIVIVLLKTVLAPHASAKNASNRAFDAVYGGNYDDFVEVTIYNADCMVDLGLTLSGELHNQIEPFFETLKASLKDSQLQYRRTKTTVEEYARGEEGFEKGVELLRGEYFDVYDGRIERMARAVIEFNWSFLDANGKRLNGKDSDVYWSICIDGKWYAIPNIDELEETTSE